MNETYMNSNQKSAKEITALYPIGSRVVIYPIERNLLLESGLMLPETAQEKPTEGIVAAVGYIRDESGDKIEMDVFVGDRVLLAKYGSLEVEIGDAKYLVVNYDDILAVVYDD